MNKGIYVETPNDPALQYIKEMSHQLLNLKPSNKQHMNACKRAQQQTQRTGQR